MSSKSVSFKINFLTIVPTATILLIILKLTNSISWSWLWVLCPLWFYAIFAVVLFIVLFITYYLGDK